MTNPNAFDPREFRSALGCFATGVTVVTTRTRRGEPVGLTVNSFNSVSLQPPLVLWSLARNSPSLAAFRETGHWVVHVLAADQEAMSKRFSARGTDKFAGIETERGLQNLPLLQGCAARFQCRTAFEYDGGDHAIFVGEVLDFDRSASPPLVFHEGRYAFALPRAPSEAGAQLTGTFSKDYLGYLLGRGYYLLRRQQKLRSEQAGLSDEEYFVLAALAMHEPMRLQELERSIGDLLSGRLHEVLGKLLQQEHVRCTADLDAESVCQLEPIGRERALQRIAVAKSFEAQVIERFGAEDAFVLKTLLRKLVAVMTSEQTHSSNGTSI